MTSTSPSARKVDDFLSKISQISQERLRENNQTQNRLQNDIDVLRRSNSSSSSPYASRQNSDFDVKQLTFNRTARSQFQDRWKDVAPPKPARPSESTTENPPMPPRPKPMLPTKPKELRPEPRFNAIGQKVDSGEPEYAPSLPKRPSASVVADRDKTGREIQSTIQLPNYVARKPSGTTEIPKQSSSSPMEVFKPAPQKPVTPKKPAAFSKPSSGEKPGPPSDTSKLSDSLTVGSLKPSGPPKPGPKPTKPTLKSFESEDAQQLRNQISRLSPAKTKQNSYQLQNESLQSAVSKFSPGEVLKPSKPVKPKALGSKPEPYTKPEVFGAASRLKKTPPKDAEASAVPEALQKLQSIKKSKPVVPAKPASSVSTKPSTPSQSSMSSKPRGPTSESFQDRLSGILRASTDPGLSNKAPMKTVVERASTDPEPNGKLSHINKSRAKGPKRRLPKSIAGQGSSSSLVSADSTQSTAQKELAAEPQPLPKAKKVPPPKGKKPEFIAKPRIVSGELFI